MGVPARIAHDEQIVGADRSVGEGLAARVADLGQADLSLGPAALAVDQGELDWRA